MSDHLEHEPMARDWKARVPGPIRLASRPIRRHAGQIWLSTGHAAAVYSRDFIDVVTGRRADLMPPRRLLRPGDGDFTRVGNDFLELFIEMGGLEPDDDILDVGCGIGRMAVPLTRYVSARGSYRGFDLDEKRLRWCQRNVTSRYPNFQFELADLHNGMYRPRGRQKASEFCFPYGDRSFDFVLLTSVFTHMLPVEVDHYLREIERVLRPGGTAFITWFLLRGTDDGRLGGGRVFAFHRGDHALQSESVPEAAVAYPEADVRAKLARANLSVVEPIIFGSWRGGKRGGASYQDIVISRRAQQRAT